MQHLTVLLISVIGFLGLLYKTKYFKRRSQVKSDEWNELGAERLFVV